MVNVNKDKDKVKLVYRFGYENMNHHAIVFNPLFGDKRYPFVCTFSFKVNYAIVRLLESSGILLIDPDFSSIDYRESSMYVIPKNFYSTDKFIEVLADIFEKFDISGDET